MKIEITIESEGEDPLKIGFKPRKEGDLKFFEAAICFLQKKKAEFSVKQIEENKNKFKNYMTDVHTEHCCKEHGCKYGDKGCTVANGSKPQSHPCESCSWEYNW